MVDMPSNQTKLLPCDPSAYNIFEDHIVKYLNKVNVTSYL